MEFEAVIGLEVHAQLSTNTKTWCNCEVTAHALENTRVCPVCSGQPGTLPVLNKKVVEYASKLALATNAKVNQLSYFDRKNYFYPDLPKGYQITQYEIPLASDGHIMIELPDGKEKRVGIERIQIEEDAGKSTHEGHGSLINLNRAGTPLIEIVGRPDLRSAEEASRYLKTLHSILMYLEICKGNLQEGNFRCDVNVSLRPFGSKVFGTRTETKNLNSFKNVEKLIETEIKRQADIITGGGEVMQQTLKFDAFTGTITPLRTKSEAHDYRYFPEPDLLPLTITEKELKKWQSTLPELPVEKQKRFVGNYGIPIYDAEVLTSDKNLANYFEDACSIYKGDPKKVSNWIMTELLRYLNEAGISILKSPVSAKDVGELLNSVESGKISGKMAKEVFEKMYDQGKGAEEVIKELGLEQISDETELVTLIEKVVMENPREVELYAGGKEKLFGFFVGQVMKASKGQANPKLVNKLLKQELGKLKK